MRLWTVSSVKMIEELKTNKTVVCNKTIGDYMKTDRGFLEAYMWMRERMIERIGLSSTAYFPLWVWHIYEGSVEKPKIDLKKGQCLLELDLDSSRVLLSDFMAWHSVLNKGFMAEAKTEEELDLMDQDFYRLPKNYRDQLREKSWELVFELDKLIPIYSDGDYIQGTIWEIREEDVVNIYMN